MRFSEQQAEEEEDPEDVIAHVEDPEILVEETDDACDQGGFLLGISKGLAFGYDIADIADWKSHEKPWLPQETVNNGC